MAGDEHARAEDGEDDGSAGTTRGQHLDDAHHDHHEDDEDGKS